MPFRKRILWFSSALTLWLAQIVFFNCCQTGKTKSHWKKGSHMTENLNQCCQDRTLLTQCKIYNICLQPSSAVASALCIPFNHISQRSCCRNIVFPIFQSFLNIHFDWPLWYICEICHYRTKSADVKKFASWYKERMWKSTTFFHEWLKYRFNYLYCVKLRLFHEFCNSFITAY